MDELSLPQARRLAVAAQGLGRPRPAGTPGLRQVRGVLDRLGVLQIDSVNVLARSHYLPLFARLGDYDRGLLARLAYGRPRRLFETWAHAASFVPVDLEPVLRFRRARWVHDHEEPPGTRDVLRRVAEEGPLAASDLEKRSTPGTWWSWSAAKQSLEWLFGAGEVHVATRRPSFEREYDVTERVLPAAVLAAPTVEEDEARRRLLVQAAGVLGVATYADLCDWWRLKPRVTAPRLPELLEAGELVRVRVRGWAEPAYALPGTVVPRRVGGAALLSPFDNLVWCRPRVERLWGVRMRIEIYTPAARRRQGYYVLPFLVGDAVAAWVDAKADRPAGVLRVLAAHREAGHPGGAVTGALAAELGLLAGWLGLDRVGVEPRGDLAAGLAADLAADLA